MNISKKIKTIDKKIGQNKAQYNFNRETAIISTVSSGNVSKYQFLTGEDVLPEKFLLEKVATLKRFEYSPLGSGLKKQRSIAKDQYKFFEDQINLVNKKREDDVKAEDGVKRKNGEIIDNVHHRYFGREDKNLIANIVSMN